MNILAQTKKYAAEAKARWGNTKAFKQSEKRVKKLGNEGLRKVVVESGKITEEIALCMKSGDEARSEHVQKLIAKHYDALRVFYEPNHAMYKGLAKMYIEDPRFKANYEKVAKGLAEFMHDAMICFVRKD